jgi:hypothetical protein
MSNEQFNVMLRTLEGASLVIVCFAVVPIEPFFGFFTVVQVEDPRTFKADSNVSF